MDWTMELTGLQGGVTLYTQEPMAGHISFRVGGCAQGYAVVRSVEGLKELLRFATEFAVKTTILGAGSNVLVGDDGLEGLVISTHRGLTGLSQLDETTICAQSGVTMARLANFARDLGLTGLEFAQGIPGTVGGGIFMNAGAYGGEMSQVATRTRAVYFDGTEQVFVGADQGFSYRHSRFQGEKAVIVETEFSLKPGNIQEINEKMLELSKKRRSSQPLEYPSGGSTFKRPPEGYAAAMIDKAGLKGLAVGGAQVSEKHAGFVVNKGGATCRDILDLMDLVQKRVWEAEGVWLEPEIQLL